MCFPPASQKNGTINRACLIRARERAYGRCFVAALKRQSYHLLEANSFLQIRRFVFAYLSR